MEHDTGQLRDGTARLEAIKGDDAVLAVRLGGRCTAAGSLPTPDTMLASVTGTVRELRLVDAGIGEWDSALLVWIMSMRKLCAGRDLALDLSHMPQGVRKLIGLATAVAPRKGTDRPQERESLFCRVGNAALESWSGLPAVLAFVGECTLSFGRMFCGRARYRRSELWLIIQQCGPQALGIVTIVSVLVGAILAFVGAVQLQMFGAEVYVANLVGLGMVIEMGALMTGIILAGRTGAAFAAQLGTMQVNEEIDALQTMGIPPIDYLVLPRMTALALMTPLLVAYADILGILGGAAVGVFLLKIPATLFFNQTFSTMTLWHVAQGLIKGATFGVLVAFCGCWWGMKCGRSASAVGDAATSAVVTSLVCIVLADAIWTMLFMVIG